MVNILKDALPERKESKCQKTSSNSSLVFTICCWKYHHKRSCLFMTTQSPRPNLMNDDSTKWHGNTTNKQHRDDYFLRTVTSNYHSSSIVRYFGAHPVPETNKFFCPAPSCGMGCGIVSFTEIGTVARIISVCWNVLPHISAKHFSRGRLCKLKVVEAKAVIIFKYWKLWPKFSFLYSWSDFPRQNHLILYPFPAKWDHTWINSPKNMLIYVPKTSQRNSCFLYLVKV